jgi:K+-transporting ATPase KdpF subunit
MRAPEVAIMSILTIIVLAITVLMMGYLVVTLLYPEKF